MSKENDIYSAQNSFDQGLITENEFHSLLDRANASDTKKFMSGQIGQPLIGMKQDFTKGETEYLQNLKSGDSSSYAAALDPSSDQYSVQYDSSSMRELIDLKSFGSSVETIAAPQSDEKYIFGIVIGFLVYKFLIKGKK